MDSTSFRPVTSPLGEIEIDLNAPCDVLRTYLHRNFRNELNGVCGDSFLFISPTAKVETNFNTGYKSSTKNNSTKTNNNNSDNKDNVNKDNDSNDSNDNNNSNKNISGITFLPRYLENRTFCKAVAPYSTEPRTLVGRFTVIIIPEKGKKKKTIYRHRANDEELAEQEIIDGKFLR